jgi:hypothetical protein
MDTLRTIDYDELRKEIRSLVQFSEKRYLTDISWEITDEPKHATKFDNDEFRPLTDEEWNEVQHKDYNTAYLIVPITRFMEVTDVIPIGRELNAKTIITKIHEFYHTPLSTDKVDDIRNYPNDCLGYNDEVVKKAYNGEVVRYVDLRGAAIYFEGIRRVSGNVYKLDFGS